MTDKTVMITGAGIGIGRATAKAFGHAGFRVIVTDVLDTEGAAVAKEVNDAGGNAEFHPLDVTSTEAANDVVADIEKRFGKLDVVVANAGIARKVPLDDLSDAHWDNVMDVDLKGMLRVIRPASKKMRKSGTGAIICLSSIMGVAYGWDQHVHYSAAKAGVVGLVRGLAVELASSGVRVNGIAPGYIRTAQLLSEEHSLGQSGLAEAESFIPMGRVGEPEDIADVIVFLASDSARYLTGQVIPVDGGLLVGRY